MACPSSSHLSTLPTSSKREVKDSSKRRDINMEPARASSPPSEPAESELHKARASSPSYDRLPNWVPEWIPDCTPGSPTEMRGNLDAVPLSSRSSKSLLFPRGRRMLGRAKEHLPLSKGTSATMIPVGGSVSIGQIPHIQRH